MTFVEDQDVGCSRQEDQTTDCMTSSFVENWFHDSGIPLVRRGNGFWRCYNPVSRFQTITTSYYRGAHGILGMLIIPSILIVSPVWYHKPRIIRQCEEMDGGHWSTCPSSRRQNAHRKQVWCWSTWIKECTWWTHQISKTDHFRGRKTIGRFIQADSIHGDEVPSVSINASHLTLVPKQERTSSKVLNCSHRMLSLPINHKCFLVLLCQFLNLISTWTYYLLQSKKKVTLVCSGMYVSKETMDEVMMTPTKIFNLISSWNRREEDINAMHSQSKAVQRISKWLHPSRLMRV